MQGYVLGRGAFLSLPDGKIYPQTGGRGGRGGGGSGGGGGGGNIRWTGWVGNRRTPRLGDGVGFTKVTPLRGPGSFTGFSSFSNPNGGSGSGSDSDSSSGPWATKTGSEFFITSVSFAQKEKYHVVQCFNDRNYTYAFGHDPLASLVEVQFTVFLVNGDNDFGSALQTLVAAYKANRLSARPAYATLTLGALRVKGFVVGMQTATMDPHLQTQAYTVLLLLVEAQDG
jgi:hypothetical protein